MVNMVNITQNGHWGHTAFSTAVSKMKFEPVCLYTKHIIVHFKTTTVKLFSPSSRLIKQSGCYEAAVYFMSYVTCGSAVLSS